MAKAKFIKNKYVPVSIIITLETKDELDWFTKIFNFLPICNISDLRHDWCEPIREACENAGGDTRTFPLTEIMNEYHKNKVNNS